MNPTDYKCPVCSLHLEAALLGEGNYFQQYQCPGHFILSLHSSQQESGFVVWWENKGTKYQLSSDNWFERGSTHLYYGKPTYNYSWTNEEAWQLQIEPDGQIINPIPKILALMIFS